MIEAESEAESDMIALARPQTATHQQQQQEMVVSQPAPRSVAAGTQATDNERLTACAGTSAGTDMLEPRDSACSWASGQPAAGLAAPPTDPQSQQSEATSPPTTDAPPATSKQPTAALVAPATREHDSGALLASSASAETPRHVLEQMAAAKTHMPRPSSNDDCEGGAAGKPQPVVPLGGGSEHSSAATSRRASSMGTSGRLLSAAGGDGVGSGGGLQLPACVRVPSSGSLLGQAASLTRDTEASSQLLHAAAPGPSVLAQADRPKSAGGGAAAAPGAFSTLIDSWSTEDPTPVNSERLPLAGGVQQSLALQGGDSLSGSLLLLGQSVDGGLPFDAPPSITATPQRRLLADTTTTPNPEAQTGEGAMPDPC